MRIYLDIETTFSQAISVIGLYSNERGSVQLVGAGVRDMRLYDALAGASEIITFAGTSFDLPMIKKRLLADLKREYRHTDLMFVCRKRGYRGGLKAIEQQLGINRATAGMSGYDAPRLWERYERADDSQALATLLHYNREDVINLAVIEALIAGQAQPDLNQALQIVTE